MKSTPDWVRRCIRLVIALLFFGFAGHGVLFDPERFLPEGFLDEYQRSCLWAAITAIVVNAPLIGRVTQTSTERFLGTLAGGLLGYWVYVLGSKIYPDGKGDDVFQVLMTAAVGGLSCYLAFALNLDMTPRFFGMTFLLITWSAPTHQAAFLVAMLRTGGILIGVLLMQFLAIIILPKSASISAFRDLSKALNNMCDLSDMVWNSNALTASSRPPSEEPTHHSPSFRQHPWMAGRNSNSSGKTNVESKKETAKKPKRNRQSWWEWLTEQSQSAVAMQDGSIGEDQPFLGNNHIDSAAHDVENIPFHSSASSMLLASREFEGFAAAMHGGPDAAMSPGTSFIGQIPPKVKATVAGQPQGSGRAFGGGGGNASSQLKRALSMSVKERSQLCEKALAGVYTALAACEENVKLSAAEIYLWHFWGHYIFLPGLPNLGRLFSNERKRHGHWHLNAVMVANMADSLRRLSRLLWNANLSLAEELTPELKTAVEAVYGRELLPQLAQACGAALRCLADAFPEPGALDTSALHRVAELLLVMQAASSEQHRRIIQRLTESDSGRQLLRRASLRATSVMPSPSMSRGEGRFMQPGSYMPHGSMNPWDVPESLQVGPSYLSHGPLNPIQEKRPASASTLTTFTGSRPPRPPGPTAGPAATRSKSAMPSVTASPFVPANTASASATTATASAAQLLRSSASPAAEPAAPATPATPAGPAAAASGGGPAIEPAPTTPQPDTSLPALEPSTIPGDTGSLPRTGSGPRLGSPRNSAGAGELSAAFAALPGGGGNTGTPGLAAGMGMGPSAPAAVLPGGIGAGTAAPTAALHGALSTASSGAAGNINNLRSFASGASSQLSQMPYLAGEQGASPSQGGGGAGAAAGLLFSATPDGHIAQVRWASFEFLVFALGDELEELFTAVSALTNSLPHPLRHI